MDNVKKLKRTSRLISVLSKYGFETLVTQTGFKKLIPEGYIERNEKRKEIFSLSVYERIRMTLEELGPAYVKLGQLMSNRDDILPEELTIELQKLQDNVTTEDVDVYATIKEELGVEASEIFQSVDTVPIASASLSQVYSAVLKDGEKKVIIKVKRKGIKDIIEADVLIMKDFARLLENYYEAARSMGLTHILHTFENSVMGELSFSQELINIERFRKNFENDKTVYVPVTYKEFSNVNLLVMEYIDGIKVSDKEALKAHGIDTQGIASKAVDSYMRQVMEFGFFHGDPHSGNIFVLRDGRIVFIDYGSMGRMFPNDEENIAEFVVCVLRKDTRRLLRIIKKIAVRYNIANDAQLERELYEFLDILDTRSVKELDMGYLVKKFSRLLNENRIILPDFVYLLARGIVLLEGIGRELGIEFNVMEFIRPYGTKLMQKRLNPKYLTEKIIYKLYDIGDRMIELPDDLSSLLQRINNGQLKITHTLTGLTDIKNTINRLVVSILVFALAIGSSILILAEMPPLVWGVSLLGFIGFTVSGMLAIILIFIILRNRREE